MESAIVAGKNLFWDNHAIGYYHLQPIPIGMYPMDTQEPFSQLQLHFTDPSHVARYTSGNEGYKKFGTPEVYQQYDNY